MGPKWKYSNNVTPADLVPSWRDVNLGRSKAKVEEDTREASLKELAERVIADEAERKAKRDRKYAARKARQR